MTRFGTGVRVSWFEAVTASVDSGWPKGPRHLNRLVLTLGSDKRPHAVIGIQDQDHRSFRNW